MAMFCGILAETLHVVIGCLALKECYITKGKVFHNGEWVGVGALGGLFAGLLALVPSYGLYKFDVWLRAKFGNTTAFYATAVLVPVAYIGYSVFGGFVGWQLLRHTLKGDYDASLSRALLMGLIGSVVFAVPLSLMLMLKRLSLG